MLPSALPSISRICDPSRVSQYEIWWGYHGLFSILWYVYCSSGSQVIVIILNKTLWKGVVGEWCYSLSYRYHRSVADSRRDRSRPPWRVYSRRWSDSGQNGSSPRQYTFHRPMHSHTPCFPSLSWCTSQLLEENGGFGEIRRFGSGIFPRVYSVDQWEGLCEVTWPHKLLKCCALS